MTKSLQEDGWEDVPGSSSDGWEDVPEALKKPSGLLRRTVGDTAAGLAAGVALVPEGVLNLTDLGVDIADAGLSYATGIQHPLTGQARTESTAKTLGITGLRKSLQGLQSPESQAATKAQQASAAAAEQQAKAEGAGWLGQLGASAKGGALGLVEHPGSILPLVTETLPSMLVAGKATEAILQKPAKALLAKATTEAEKKAAEATIAKWAGRVAPAIEGAQTSGQVAGDIVEQNPDATVAQRALAIPAGMATGAIAKGTDLIPGLGNVESQMAQAALTGTKAIGSRAKGALKGSVSEGLLQEPLQSGQEAALTNIGTEKPWYEGVGNQALLGGVAGFGIGGAMGAKSSGSASTPETPQEILNKAGLSTVGLITLRNTPEALAKHGLTTGHVDALLDTRTDLDYKAIQTSLDTAPSDAVRQGILAGLRTAAPEVTVSTPERPTISLGEAYTQISSRLNELSNKSDLTPSEEAEFRTIRTFNEKLKTPGNHEDKALFAQDFASKYFNVNVELPVAQEPVAQEPVAQEPVAQEPVAQEPVAQIPEGTKILWDGKEMTYVGPDLNTPGQHIVTDGTREYSGYLSEPVAQEPIVPVAQEPIVPVAQEPVVPVAQEPVAQIPEGTKVTLDDAEMTYVGPDLDTPGLHVVTDGKHEYSVDLSELKGLPIHPVAQPVSQEPVQTEAESQSKSVQTTEAEQKVESSTNASQNKTDQPEPNVHFKKGQELGATRLTSEDLNKLSLEDLRSLQAGHQEGQKATEHTLIITNRLLELGIADDEIYTRHANALEAQEAQRANTETLQAQIAKATYDKTLAQVTKDNKQQDRDTLALDADLAKGPESLLAKGKANLEQGKDSTDGMVTNDIRRYVKLVSTVNKENRSNKNPSVAEEARELALLKKIANDGFQGVALTAVQKQRINELQSLRKAEPKAKAEPKVKAEPKANAKTEPVVAQIELFDLSDEALAAKVKVYQNAISALKTSAAKKVFNHKPENTALLAEVQRRKDASKPQTSDVRDMTDEQLTEAIASAATLYNTAAPENRKLHKSWLATLNVEHARRAKATAKPHAVKRTTRAQKLLTLLQQGPISYADLTPTQKDAFTDLWQEPDRVIEHKNNVISLVASKTQEGPQLSELQKASKALFDYEDSQEHQNFKKAQLAHISSLPVKERAVARKNLPVDPKLVELQRQVQEVSKVLEVSEAPEVSEVPEAPKATFKAEVAPEVVQALGELKRAKWDAVAAFNLADEALMVAAESGVTKDIESARAKRDAALKENDAAILSLDNFVEAHPETSKVFSSKNKKAPKTIVNNETGRAYILEDLVASVYKAGMSLAKFSMKIKVTLGKAYSKVRAYMSELYEEIRAFTKSTMGNEIGAVDLVGAESVITEDSNGYATKVVNDDLGYLWAIDTVSYEKKFVATIYSYEGGDEHQRTFNSLVEASKWADGVLRAQAKIWTAKATENQKDRIFYESPEGQAELLVKKLEYETKEQALLAEPAKDAAVLHKLIENLPTVTAIDKGYKKSLELDLKANHKDSDNSLLTPITDKYIKSVALRKGYTLPVFHGSPYEVFFTFDSTKAKGSTGARAHKDNYVTTNWRTAQTYAHRLTRGGGFIHSLFLKVTNPLVKDFENKVWTEASGALVDSWVTEAKENGNDALIINRILDNLGPTMGPQSSIVFFKPTDVKLANAITYSPDGSIIPVSERFIPTNPDIRYSVASDKSSKERASVELLAAKLTKIMGKTWERLQTLGALRKAGGVVLTATKDEALALIDKLSTPKAVKQSPAKVNQLDKFIRAIGDLPLVETQESVKQRRAAIKNTRKLTPLENAFFDTASNFVDDLDSSPFGSTGESTQGLSDPTNLVALAKAFIDNVKYQIVHVSPSAIPSDQILATGYEDTPKIRATLAEELYNVRERFVNNTQQWLDNAFYGTLSSQDITLVKAIVLSEITKKSIRFDGDKKKIVTSTITDQTTRPGSLVTQDSIQYFVDALIAGKGPSEAHKHAVDKLMTDREALIKKYKSGYPNWVHVPKGSNPADLMVLAATNLSTWCIGSDYSYAQQYMGSSDLHIYIEDDGTALIAVETQTEADAEVITWPEFLPERFGFTRDPNSDSYVVAGIFGSGVPGDSQEPKPAEQDRAGAYLKYLGPTVHVKQGPSRTDPIGRAIQEFLDGGELWAPVTIENGHLFIFHPIDGDPYDLEFPDLPDALQELIYLHEDGTIELDPLVKYLEVAYVPEGTVILGPSVTYTNTVLAGHEFKNLEQAKYVHAVPTTGFPVLKNITETLYASDGWVFPSLETVNTLSIGQDGLVTLPKVTSISILNMHASAVINLADSVAIRDIRVADNSEVTINSNNIQTHRVRLFGRASVKSNAQVFEVNTVEANSDTMGSVDATKVSQVQATNSIVSFPRAKYIGAISAKEKSIITAKNTEAVNSVYVSDSSVSVGGHVALIHGPNGTIEHLGESIENVSLQEGHLETKAKIINFIRVPNKATNTSLSITANELQFISSLTGPQSFNSAFMPKLEYVSIYSDGSPYKPLSSASTDTVLQEIKKNLDQEGIASVLKDIKLFSKDPSALWQVLEDGQALIDSNKTQGVQESVYRGTQALYHEPSGVTFVIAENADPETVEGLIAHEVGVHAANDPIIEAKAVELYESSLGTPFMKGITSRLKTAGITSDSTHYSSEVHGYIIEEALGQGKGNITDTKFWTTLKWALPKKVYDFVRAWVSKIQRVMPNHVYTVQDLVAIAQDNVKRASKGALAFTKSTLGNEIGAVGKNVHESVAPEYEALTDELKAEVLPFKDYTKAEWEAMSKEQQDIAKAMDSIFNGKPKSERQATIDAANLLAKSKNPFVKAFAKYTASMSGLHRNEDNQNTNWATRILSSPEYYLKRSTATFDMVKAALKSDDLKHTLREKVLGDFLKVASKIAKKNPKAYEQAQKYLLDTDRSGIGFTIKDKGDGVWVVNDRTGKEIFSSTNEVAAENAQIDAEQEWLQKQLFSADARRLISEARRLTNRAFGILADDIRKQMQFAKDHGIEEPTDVFVDDDGNKEVLKISELMAKMGDLRGTYFPRERVARKFHLVAEHPTKAKILETYDALFIENSMDYTSVDLLKKLINSATPAGRRYKELKAQGYTVKINKVGTPTDLLFDLPGTISNLDAIINTAMTKAQEGVKAKSIEIEKTKGAWAASIYEAAEKAYLTEVGRALTMRIADLKRSKGNLSSRMARSEDYFEGFETDIIKALTTYATRVSTGLAMRTTAKRMLEAFMGRSTSWDDYVKKHPEAEYSEYLRFVATQKVNPNSQNKLYEDAQTYMRFFLKPNSPTDNAIGVLKSLAVFMYLGFKVSSAAVNLTSLAISVPATIAVHTGTSISKTFKYLGSSLADMASYKHNQLLQERPLYAKSVKALGGKPRQVSKTATVAIDYINHQGWGEAKFNQEAMMAMSGKLGAKYNKLMETAMYMFGVTESINRTMTILAAYKAYNGGTLPKVLNEELMAKAYDTSNSAHGIYGKAAKPWMVQTLPLLDMPYTFMKFQHNQYLNMIELSTKYKAPSSVAYMMLSSQLLAGTSVLSALGFAIAKALGADDPEEDYVELMSKAFGEPMARYGVTGLAGVSLKGSLAAKMPFPTDFSELLGAPASVVTDLIESSIHFWHGETSKGFEKALPGAFGNMLKGHREKTEGLTKENYSPVIEDGEYVKGSDLDFVRRFMSFAPAELSTVRNVAWKESEVQRKYQEKREGIAREFNRLSLQGKPATDPEWAELWKDISVYNKRASSVDPKYGVSYIDYNWLKQTYMSNFKPDKYGR